MNRRNLLAMIGLAPVAAVPAWDTITAAGGNRFTSGAAPQPPGGRIVGPLTLATWDDYWRGTDCDWLCFGLSDSDRDIHRWADDGGPTP